MSNILERVQVLLDRSNREGVEIPPSILDEFAKACRDALERQFSKPSEGFTLRMSNVGKPLCQLQSELEGRPQENPPYNHKMNMLIGDLIEASAIAILKLSGQNVKVYKDKIGLDIGGTRISGTPDVGIDSAIWDIKSASDYSFTNKFSAGYDAVAKEDDFGYVCQGFGYAEAEDTRFGGWIAINKENGQWVVTYAPEGEKYQEERKKALAQIEANVQAIRQSKPFVRCFEDEPELFYNKETGNRHLNRTCSWCRWKDSCWPDLKIEKQRASKAKNPRRMYYTVIQDTLAQENDQASNPLSVQD